MPYHNQSAYYVRGAGVKINRNIVTDIRLIDRTYCLLFIYMFWE